MITTPQGKIDAVEERGILVFRGIPYARPPVEERRLRAPEPTPAWRGVRPAVSFGPSAPQNSPNVRLFSQLMGIGAAVQSEDCLYLNVWTPAADRKRRPVMVWIHGGAFVLGSGSTGLYAGGRMAKRGDVVVVTINYRLGALGFLNLHSLDDRLEANLGLRDQIAALGWVRENIEQFGGDPENVTIFGESAGGMSVGTLLGTPAARGLFHRAIAQSGAARHVSSPQRAAAVADEFLRQLDVKGLEVEQLRRQPVEDILRAQARASLKMGFPVGVLTWQPSLDGDVLPAAPMDAIAVGSAESVRVMVGTNRDEWRLFMLGDASGRRLDEDGLRRRLSRAFPSANGNAEALGERAFEEYKRIGDGRRGWTPAERWVAFQSDRVFHYPAQELSEAHARSGGGTYAYLFTWTPPIVGSWLGSFHGLEIPFVFGTVRDGVLRRVLAPQRAVRELSDIVQDAWISFARSGDPTHPRLPAWPRYEPASRPTIVLGPECFVQYAPFEERRRFWAEVVSEGRAQEQGTGHGEQESEAGR